MVMKRLFPLFALVLVVACNKPSDEMCRKAIRNMRTLLGTDSATSQTDINGDVRRCKGGSTKKAVECAAKATTVDELRACDFMGHKKGGDEPAGSAPPPAGSGTATAGSAGAPTMGGDTGSAAPAGSAAPTGSAAPAGSAAPTGSAAAPAAGSAADSSAAPATGSAADSATGSAATGSAAGSAAGSAK
jgi:preprotein translocase subunit SecD